MERSTPVSQSRNQQKHPPSAEGFNAAHSDTKAIAIADEVMSAMGSRKNWDDTRYITWRFFGFRLHVWDKWIDDLRFEQSEMTVLMNVHIKKPSPPSSNKATAASKNRGRTPCRLKSRA